jgi:hypothetical protein
MKIQTLNKKQQVKLLILCNEFFPDYFIELLETDNELDNNFFIEMGEVNIVELEIDRKLLIHWYQLCLTELPKRIDKKLNRKKYEVDIFESGGDDLLKDCLNSEHPVDFLWNFVEEAKKNKYFKK